MKKIISSILIAIFLLFLTSPIPVHAAYASQKEEVVYGILGLDGNVKDLYVVNIFNGGNITDFGDYTQVHNLTTSEEIIQNNDQISIHTQEKKLYYQGTLKAKELPWDINIKYQLDGKELSPAELAGKSGALQIEILVTKNDKMDSFFYDNYALQIMLKLDTKLCDNIKSENATIAEAGSSKQLSYIILPGKGSDIRVTADVHDFEMEEISINGIKLALSIDLDYDQFSGELNQLVEAIQELDDGAGELSDGAKQLADGMNQYIEGLKAYRDGLTTLEGGVKDLDSGAVALRDGLAQLGKQNDTLVNGALALQTATFDTINNQLEANGIKLPTLTPQNYSKILSDIPDLALVKGQLDGLVQFTKGLEGYVGGVAQLQIGATSLAEGTSKLKSGVSTITSSAKDLYLAAFELNTAVKALRDGLATYQAGTNQLNSGTSDIDEQINDKIDEFVKDTFGSDDKVVSFVSDKNENVESVQFVLKTEGILYEKPEDIKQETTTHLNFWQKLLKLFGLL